MYVYMGERALGERLSPICYLENCVDQGLVNLLCKGPDGKYLSLCRPLTDSVTCPFSFLFCFAFYNPLKI